MTTCHAGFQNARSFLFVPGDRPERFTKAEHSGADIVVLDLEDAVAPDAKLAARDHVLTYLRSRKSELPIAVRVNSPQTADGEADLAALGGLSSEFGVVVPKADVASMQVARSLLPAATALMPLVESARGIHDAWLLAEGESVVRLLFGHLDLAAELGIDPDDDASLTPARFVLRAASAAASLVPPVDGVSRDFRDPSRVAADTAASLRAGFTAKLCIHPAQVAVVHEALLPTSSDVDWARRVIEAGNVEGVSAVGGMMVDRPVLLRAEDILRRSGESR